MAERVALNFLQRMSGIATLTRRMVDAVQVISLLKRFACDSLPQCMFGESPPRSDGACTDAML